MSSIQHGMRVESTRTHRTHRQRFSPQRGSVPAAAAGGASRLARGSARLARGSEGTRLREQAIEVVVGEGVEGARDGQHLERGLLPTVGGRGSRLEDQEEERGMGLPA